MNKNIKNIGILIAMEEEAKPIIEGLGLELIKSEQNGCKVYSKDNKVLIVAGIGSLNACIAAVTLITAYSCNIIFNAGTCGATGASFKPGDILSVKRVYKRDVDLTLSGYKKYQYPCMDKEYIDLVPDSSFILCDCYSSDEFVGEKSSVPSDVAVEMEAFACAFTAKKYGVQCRIYKVVSDSTVESTDDSEFKSNLDSASKKLSDYLVNIIKDY